MGVEYILIFYHLSFKCMFVFSNELWRCRTRVLGWRENSCYIRHTFKKKREEIGLTIICNSPLLLFLTCHSIFHIFSFENSFFFI